MKPTDVTDPEYYHKVVDCQYACPAHTPVPEYIRLIAARRYADAYMLNWESNVFPGVLGRTCDRPCEPACRRVRVEKEAVAICRLKRVAADHKGDIRARLPAVPSVKNGKRIALIGAGPASLTVARDLLLLGYSIDLYDEQGAGGGFMRSQIPAFRLPEKVLNEEVNVILDMGVISHFNHYVDSLKGLLDSGSYDAVFVGSGAPLGRDLDISGRLEAKTNVHIGINWLAAVAFGHVQKIGKRVLVLGGGNTAMDCCRTARRLGGEEVRVVVRSPFEEMKASPWEKADAQHEGIPIYDNHVPKAFLLDGGKLVGMRFEKVKAIYERGQRELIATGEPPVDMACDDVLVAIGQQNAFPWIERDSGVEFDQRQMPVVDPLTFQSSHPKVFFGGDAAFGPENVITAVAHGHQAAISIDLLCRGEALTQRPPPGVSLVSQKMGIHEWSYDSRIEDDERYVVPQAALAKALGDRRTEVELGFDAATAFHEAQRCLNCDQQTVFSANLCIECDACIDICPTACLTFAHSDVEEPVLRQQLTVAANNLEQAVFVSEDLGTGRAMIKDENVCLHCGLCAERCPTAAWDMQQFYYHVTQAGQGS